MIKPVTLDLLDASIPASFDEWQKLPDEVRFPHYAEKFRTDPIFWRRHLPANWAFDLDWKEFRYADMAHRSHVDALIKSQSPGIYIFYIRPERLLYRFPQFALYVGISNERGSIRPLRDRLKDYLPATVANKGKRDNIDRMLRLYYGVLWIAYALSDKPSKHIERLEVQLHGYLYPRYDRRDFPVDIKKQQKRFGTI